MLSADDSYLYCKATVEVLEDAINILELLRKFERASGQQVYLQKSSVFFNSNPIGYNIMDICNTLHKGEAGEHNLYLGLSNILDHNKFVILSYLNDKVRKKFRAEMARCYLKVKKNY